jgi:thioredoxin reductase (NADPH)
MEISATPPKSIVDLTVVGGGPVGLYGAFYGGLRGMSIRIIDSLPELGGQMRALYPEKFIYDMPGYPKVLAGDLALQMIQQATRYHPDLMLQQTAKSLIPTDFGYNVVTESGIVCPTRTVLVTAGAGAFSPREIGVDNEKRYVGKGVFYSVDSRERFANKNLVVVGGGNSACDWALSLHAIADRVTLIHRRNTFRAHEDTVERLHRSGVQVRLWSVVRALDGNGKLRGVVIENTQTNEVERLDADAVLVNIGFRSALGYLKEWGLKTDHQHIVVDHHYRTNLPGVFAAGDICDYPGKLKLIATGVGEAATAVCFAKIHIDPSARLYPGHSSDQGDL